MRYKTGAFVIVAMLTARCLLAQEVSKLTIDSCYARAKRYYPLIKQQTLLEKSKNYSIENVTAGYFPQIVVAGQATYQSEVTKFSLPASLSAFTSTSLIDISKDQYRVYAEISQPITDLFFVESQRDLVRATTSVESQRTEVELYKLKDRMNQLFFGLLFIDAQIEQVALLKGDIENGIAKVKASIANGTMLKINENQLKAELIKAGQREMELKINRKNFMDMLASFIRMPLDETTKLEVPSVQPIPLDIAINRPELKLFDEQKKGVQAQESILLSKIMPRVSLFFQGGYGRPALNMLSNEFDPYYIAGVRLSWNITGFYTYFREAEITSLNESIVEAQREAFIFNTNLTLSQQKSEVAKYQEMLASDKQIVEIKQDVKNTAKNQLEFGTISANDYLSYVNSEDRARQDMILHQIQLLMAQYNQQTTLGYETTK